MQRNIEHMQLSGFHFHPYPEEPQLCVCGTLAFGRKNLDSRFGNSKRSESLNIFKSWLGLLQLVRRRGIFLACFSNFVENLWELLCVAGIWVQGIVRVDFITSPHSISRTQTKCVSVLGCVLDCLQWKIAQECHVYALDHFGSR